MLKQNSSWSQMIFNARLERFCLVMMALIVMLLFFEKAAFASSDDLPWNTALQKLVNALSGKTAMLISMIGIFFAGGMLIFGGDLGNFGKSLMMVVLVGSMMGGLSSVVGMFMSEGALLL